MNTTICSSQKIFWKRLGMAGFAFFLVKGLAWLALPIVLYWLNITG